MIKAFGFIVTLIITSTAFAEDALLTENETAAPAAVTVGEYAPEIPVYQAKMVYREHLQENKLNPTDEEIQKQIDIIKENPGQATQELLQNAKPAVTEFDEIPLRVLTIQQKKPKRLGNHQLYINPDIF